MALHQQTMKLTPAQADVIPIGKFIKVDESHLLKPEPYVAGQYEGRPMKNLVPSGFDQRNPYFVPVYTPAPSMTQNYGGYIYNSVTGWQ